MNLSRAAFREPIGCQSGRHYHTDTKHLPVVLFGFCFFPSPHILVLVDGCEVDQGAAEEYQQQVVEKQEVGVLGVL